MQPRRYKLLMFDFDGTLADSNEAFRRALDAAIVEFRLKPIREEDITVLRQLSAKEIIRHLRIPW